jgi:hypothetical protein
VEETGENHRPYFFSSQKFVRVTPPTHIGGGSPKLVLAYYQMKILISTIFQQVKVTLVDFGYPV